MADQPGRRQLRVALDELDPATRGCGDRAQQGRLAGPRRTVEDDVAALVERDRDYLRLAAEADDLALD